MHIQEVVRDKHLCHKARISQLIDREYCIDIVSIRYLEKAEWQESILKQWDIRSDTRSSLIDIHKYLKIRNKYEYKERLLKWILDLP